MSVSIVKRVIGPTYAISVAATQTTAIALPPIQGDNAIYAEFTNPGATDVCVVTAPWAGTPATPALVFPVGGTPTIPNSFMLPHGMTQPMTIETPSNGFCVSAIGSAAGPSIIYITPIAAA